MGAGIEEVDGVGLGAVERLHAERTSPCRRTPHLRSEPSPKWKPVEIEHLLARLLLRALDWHDANSHSADSKYLLHGDADPSTLPVTRSQRFGTVTFTLLVSVHHKDAACGRAFAAHIMHQRTSAYITAVGRAHHIQAS
jgi:hypothetical protein